MNGIVTVVISPALLSPIVISFTVVVDCVNSGVTGNAVFAYSSTKTVEFSVVDLIVKLPVYEAMLYAFFKPFVIENVAGVPAAHGKLLWQIKLVATIVIKESVTVP